MYSNAEEQGSKKKYLVPVIALLICGMAFVGSAYAYSSSIETSKDLSTQYYEITVNNADEISFDEKLQFNAVKKDGNVTYTAVPINKKITVAMSDKNNTENFKITGATVTVTYGADKTAIQLTCVLTDAQGVEFDETKGITATNGTTDIYLKISGSLPQDVDPENSYHVTLVINTEAVNA